MPIPEPSIFRPSTLTKEQREKELAACYGVSMPEITHSEAAQMRELLARFDSQHKPIQIHDLNNPPKQPYRFERFPMIVYDLEHSEPPRDEQQPARSGLGFVDVHIPAKLISRTVRSQEELEAALLEGWSEKAPEFREEPVYSLSPALEHEANRVQERLESSRRKRA